MPSKNAIELVTAIKQYEENNCEALRNMKEDEKITHLAKLVDKSKLWDLVAAAMNVVNGRRPVDELKLQDLDNALSGWTELK